MARKNFKSDGNGGWIFDRVNVIVFLVFGIMSFTANVVLTVWLFPMNTKIKENTKCIKDQARIDHEHDLLLQSLNDRINETDNRLNKKVDETNKDQDDIRSYLKQRAGGDIVF